LLFEPLYLRFLQAAQTINSSVDALTLLQGLTTAFALLGLAAAFLLLLPRAGATAGLIGAGLVSMNFGFWHYAKVVDAYVPALSLTIVCWLIFDRRHALPPLVVPVLLAAIAGMAVLIHQLYIFSAALLWLFLLFDEAPAARRIPHAMLFATLGGGGVLVTYWMSCAANVEGATSLTTCVSWAKGHAAGGLWQPPSAQTPFLALVGLGTTVFFSGPIFAFPALRELADGWSGGRLIVEESFIVEQALGPSLSAALLILALVASALVAYLVFLSLRTARQVPFSRTELLLAAFVLMNVVLTSIWEAPNREFWIHIVAALGLFLGLRMRSLSSAGIHAAGLSAVAILGVVNFFSAIGPMSDPANDYWRQETASIVSRLGADDTVAVVCPWLCQRYVSYFSGAQVYNYSQIEGLQDADLGYLSVIAIDPATGEPSLP
jgi:hypothetical protein